LSGTIDRTARFLTAPSNESEGPFWSVLQLMKQSKSFKDGDETSSIIIGTGL